MRTRYFNVLGTTVLILLCVTGAQADRLGVIGPTYPIMEMNFLQQIQQRLLTMQKNGEFEKIQEKFKARAIQTAKEPKPVRGLSHTVNARTFFVDPGMKVEEDITDNDGKLIAPAGTYVNPLDTITMRKKLYFFDGADLRQQAAAKRFYDAETIKPKLVLVAGKPFDLMERWNIPVYFDQAGGITKHFGIQHTPAVVSQEGRMLRVDELKIN